MGIFTFGRRAYNSDLEKALQGIPVTPFEVEYDGFAGKENGSYSTPVYVLPVDTINNHVFGFFFVDGDIGQANFYFVHKNGFFDKTIYGFDVNGDLDKRSDEKIDLRLPLRETEFKRKLGELDSSGKFIESAGSPFPTYGIAGSEGVLPLLLATETEKGYVAKGIRFWEKRLVSYSEVNTKNRSRISPFVQDFLVGRHQVSVAVPSDITSSTIKPVPFIKTSKKTARNVAVNPEDPKSLVDHLDEYVIGHDEAKKAVAVAVSSLAVRMKTGDETLPKMNTMLIGSTGVGKTYMMKILAKKIGLPFAQAKLVGRSSEGYRGQNVSTVFDQIYSSTKGQEAPYGIVFLDEADKIANDDWGSGSGYGQRIQKELIGWVEEEIISREIGEGASRSQYQFSTRNLLFVMAGAFQGQGKGNALTDIISRRLAGGKTIGFGAAASRPDDNQLLLSQVQPEDLITWGFFPELVGRFPVITTLNPLTEDERICILTEAKDSPLEGYVRLLAARGYTIQDYSQLAGLIVSRCPPETGARGLSSVCSKLFRDVLYDPQRFADRQRNIPLEKLDPNIVPYDGTSEALSESG